MRIFTLRAFKAAVCCSFVCGLVTVFEWKSSLIKSAAPSPQERIIAIKHKSDTALSTTSSQSKRRKVLIITTHFRTGSSFLGQLFNQRSDTFYMYEPLYPFYGDYGRDERHKANYLNDLANCRIRDQIDVFRSIGVSTKAKTTNSGESCLKRNFCFRANSKALCSEEMCGAKGIVDCHGCSPVNTTQASIKCRLAAVVVIKVIRIWDIRYFKSVFEDARLDAKVLYLVRDPRGIHGSREGVGAPSSLSTTLNTCAAMERHWRTAVSGGNKWMKGKLKFIRYEDVCRNPHKMAQKIYQFSDLKMTSEMEQWIASNTQGIISTLRDSKTISLMQKFQKSKDETEIQKRSKRALSESATHRNFTNSNSEILKQIIIDRPYTTVRNSSANWRKWTKKIDFRKVATIQDKCKTMMSTFSYLPIAAEEEPIDQSTPIIDEFCPKNTFSLTGQLNC